LPDPSRKSKSPQTIRNSTTRRLLGLIDDVGGVYAVVRKVVVIPATPGDANTPLVAAVAVVRVHSQRSKHRQTGPIAAVQEQLGDLLAFDAGSEGM
jgi:hypothetical protein